MIFPKSCYYSAPNPTLTGSPFHSKEDLRPLPCLPRPVWTDSLFISDSTTYHSAPERSFHCTHPGRSLAWVLPSTFPMQGLSTGSPSWNHLLQVIYNFSDSIQIFAQYHHIKRPKRALLPSLISLSLLYIWPYVNPNMCIYCCPLHLTVSTTRAGTSHCVLFVCLLCCWLTVLSLVSRTVWHMVDSQ